MEANTLAYRIIACFDGYIRLAQMLGIPERRVRSWFLHGIPPEHHLDIIELSRSIEDSDIVSIDNLEQTCGDGRCYRARRQARKIARAVEAQVAARSASVSVR